MRRGNLWLWWSLFSLLCKRSSRSRNVSLIKGDLCFLLRIGNYKGDSLAFIRISDIVSCVVVVDCSFALNLHIH